MLLSIGEVSKKLGVCITTIKRWEKLNKIIITNKDRLLRFGTELIINIAKKFNTELIIVDKKEDDFNTLLVNDVLEIITVFSSKLYGKRSHKNFNSIKY